MTPVVERMVFYSAVACLMAALMALAGFGLSFLAEGFEQEVGIGQTILGYNRDFLVQGRWWFFGLGVLFLLLAICQWWRLISGKSGARSGSGRMGFS